MVDRTEAGGAAKLNPHDEERIVALLEPRATDAAILRDGANAPPRVKVRYFFGSFPFNAYSASKASRGDISAYTILELMEVPAVCEPEPQSLRAAS